MFFVCSPGHFDGHEIPPFELKLRKCDFFNFEITLGQFTGLIWSSENGSFRVFES